MSDLAVRFRYCPADDLEHGSWWYLGVMSSQRLDYRSARYLSGRVTAHAVGNREQPAS